MTEIRGRRMCLRRGAIRGSYLCLCLAFRFSHEPVLTDAREVSGASTPVTKRAIMSAIFLLVVLGTTAVATTSHMLLEVLPSATRG